MDCDKPGPDVLRMHLINSVLDPIEASLRNHERKLCAKNHELNGSNSFWVEDRRFKLLNGNRGPAGGCDPSLRAEAFGLLRSYRMVEDDRQRIHQGLVVSLAPVETWQDLRDVLPNFVASKIENVRDLKRTRPEAWSVLGNPRAERDHRAMTDLLAKYLMADTVGV